MTGPAGRKRGLFVTGTDTGIGKTFVCALLVSALRQAGRPAGYFKPIQTGSDSDTDTVARLGGIDRLLLPSPAYRFPLPVSPNRAAAAEKIEIGLQTVRRVWDALPAGDWVVEGAGGLLVPLNERETMRDLIGALELPAIVVASTRLGTINHTLLTIEAARAARLRLAGLVLNGEADPGLAELLSRFGDLPVLAEIRPLPDLSEGIVARLGREIFPVAALRDLFEPAREGARGGAAG